MAFLGEHRKGRLIARNGNNGKRRLPQTTGCAPALSSTSARGQNVVASCKIWDCSAVPHWVTNRLMRALPRVLSTFGTAALLLTANAAHSVAQQLGSAFTSETIDPGL